MAEQPLILAVDHNARNLDLLTQVLAREGYRTLGANSLEELDRAVADSDEVALALVDIAGFDRSIWERCERLRDKGVPFLVLSPRQTAAIQQESLVHGARGILVKPLVVRELLGVVRGLLKE